jgi:hypothetical protein
VADKIYFCAKKTGKKSYEKIAWKKISVPPLEDNPIGFLFFYHKDYLNPG